MRYHTPIKALPHLLGPQSHCTFPRTFYISPSSVRDHPSRSGVPAIGKAMHLLPCKLASPPPAIRTGCCLRKIEVITGRNRITFSANPSLTHRTSRSLQHVWPLFGSRLHGNVMDPCILRQCSPYSDWSHPIALSKNTLRRDTWCFIYIVCLNSIDNRSVDQIRRENIKNNIAFSRNDELVWDVFWEKWNG
ncbi:hypothetical protein NPIL_674201 [Nephila pilipes]|uniref:Uncharacterized protein n=1 Tax=Nephila pilipes TaxID=299642 RepID=A0A8X6MQC2_NEPPI|nr:hypothetical protein NPIL_674201 [Nephila pilipes]